MLADGGRKDKEGEKSYFMPMILNISSRFSFLPCEFSKLVRFEVFLDLVYYKNHSTNQYFRFIEGAPKFRGFKVSRNAA